MLPKVHLTSDFRISGSRWVTTPSWLSGSLIPFLSSSSVYSCHLFSIYSVSLRSFCFCPLSYPSLHGMFPWCLFSGSDLQSFPLCHFPLLHCAVHLRRPSYLALFNWMKLCIQLDISFPFSVAFCFSSFLSYVWNFLRQPLSFLHFFFLWNGFGHWLYNVTNLWNTEIDTINTEIKICTLNEYSCFYTNFSTPLCPYLCCTHFSFC